MNLELKIKQHQTINLIAEKYRKYTEAKDVAIDSYNRAAMESSISSLHEKQRGVFFDLLGLCQTFSNNQWQIIQKVEDTSNHLSRKLRMITFIAIALFTSLCILFLFILYKQIPIPIRGRAIEIGGSPQESSQDAYPP